MPLGEEPGPHVLISYAHGGKTHAQAVAQLADLLGKLGCVVWWDRYHETEGLDWLDWIDEGLEIADFVLVCGSKEYAAASRSDYHYEPGDHGRGVSYEWWRIRTFLYDNRQRWLKSVLPVLLPGETPDHLPQKLWNASQIYRISELSEVGIDELRRRIVNEPKFVRPALDAGWDLASRRQLRAEAGQLPREFGRALETWRGRRAALRAVGSWLRDPKDDLPCLVVTGEPGTGKTALLGLIAHLGTGRAPQVAESVLNALPGECRPPDDAIDVALSVGNMGVERVLDLLTAAAGVPRSSVRGADITARVEGLLAHLRGRQRPFTVLLDALDEISPPEGDAQLPGPADLQPLCEELLAPLITRAHSPIRFLLGTRRTVLKMLGMKAKDDPRVIDLSDVAYQDEDALRERLETLMLAGDSIWRQALADDRRTAVDALLEEKVHGSFQVGEMIARVLARAERLPADVHSPEWLQGISSEAGDVMYADLRTRLGRGAERAVGLLLPLAYGRGGGIPWADVWLPVANALRTAGTEPYTGEDLELIRRHASSHVLESEADALGRTAFRLYHRELATYLLKQRNASGAHSHAEDERAITAALRKGVLPGPTGAPDWTSAAAYLRSHLLAHAVAGGSEDDVDQLVSDPGFLANATEVAVRVDLARLVEPRHRAVADAYRQACAALSRASVAESERVPLLLSQLSLAARCHGADTLADRVPLGHGAAPWRALWAAWLHQPPLTPLADYSGGVQVVAAARLRSGMTVALTAGLDGTIRVCDVLTGAAVGSISAHRGAVLALATGTFDDRVVAVSTGEDKLARVWDIDTLQQVGSDFSLHAEPVQAVTIFRTSAWTRVVTGDRSGLVRVWDPKTGKPKGTVKCLPKAAITALAAVTSDKVATVVTAQNDGSLHRIRLTDQQSVTPYPQTGMRAIRALTVGTLKGRPVVVSGGGDGELRVWDVVSDRAQELPTPNRVQHEDGVRALASATVGGTSAIVSVGGDNTARVWNLADSREIGAPFKSHHGSLRGLATVEGSNRPLVVLVVANSAPVVWELTANGAANEPFAGHRHQVRSLLFTKIGGRRRLVSGSSDATVRRWDPDNGGQTGRELRGHRRWIGALAATVIDQEERISSAGADCTVRTWNAATGEPVGDPVEHDGPVAELIATTAEGRPWLVSATLNGEVRAWNAKNPTEFRHYRGHRDELGQAQKITALTEIVPTSGEPYVLSAGLSGDLHLWSPGTGEAVRVWHAGHPVTSLATVSGRPELVVSGGANGTVIAHDLNTGASQEWGRQSRDVSTVSAVHGVRLIDVSGTLAIVTAHQDGTVRVSDFEAQADVTPLGAHGGEARALAVGEAGGRTVAFSGGDDGLIKVWDLMTKSPMQQLHRGRVWAVATVPADNTGRIDVLSAGDDDTIQVRALRPVRTETDASRGRRPPVQVRQAQHKGVRALAVGQAAGRTAIVSGGVDQSLQIRDYDGSTSPTRLVGHRDWVRALVTGSYPKTGPVAVSASGDGQVGVWDLERGAVIGSLRSVHDRGARAVALADLTIDDRPTPVIVSGDVLGDIRVTRLVGGAAVGPTFPRRGDGVRALASVRLEGRWAVIAGYASDGVLAWFLDDTMAGAGDVPHPEGEVNAIATRQDDDGDGCLWVAVAAGRSVTLSSWTKADSWRSRARLAFDCEVLDLALPRVETEDTIPGTLVVAATQGVVAVEFADDL